MDRPCVPSMSVGLPDVKPPTVASLTELVLGFVDIDVLCVLTCDIGSTVPAISRVVLTVQDIDLGRHSQNVQGDYSDSTILVVVLRCLAREDNVVRYSYALAAAQKR